MVPKRPDPVVVEPAVPNTPELCVDAKGDGFSAGAALPNKPVLGVVAVLPNSPLDPVVGAVPNRPPLDAVEVFVVPPAEAVELNKPAPLEVVAGLPNNPPPAAGGVALLAEANMLLLLVLVAGAAALLNKPEVVVEGLANKLEVNGLLLPFALLPNNPPVSGEALFVSDCKPNGFLGGVADFVSSDDIFRPNSPPSVSPDKNYQVLVPPCQCHSFE